MASQWIPPDISQICAEATAPLTQCSQTGFLYLTLLSQLFGRSIDDQAYPRRNPYFDAAGHSFDTIVPRPTHVPLGPTPLKLNPEINGTPLGPLLPSSTINQYKSPNAKSYLFETFYLKPDKEEPKFEFGRKFEHPYSKFDKSLEFGFNEDRYFDPATADSKKIPVAAEKTKTRSRKKRQAPEEYDFIIVGAGSAGCVLANRLSEVKKWKILLLEAGPEEPDITSVPSLAPVLAASSIDWGYRTQPEELTCLAQRGRTCSWTSGKVMGGSSAINYLVYMRGNRKDYDDWAALGNDGWSYKEVLPFFKKSENNQDIEAKDTKYHGVDGPLNVERFTFVDPNAVMLVEAFHETGLPLVDFNGENQIGTMITQTTSRDGKRASTNTAFIRPIRLKRPNLTIKTNVQVTRVLIEPAKKVAFGVNYVENNQWKTAHARKEVILSAGALNSPKILMLSGIGPVDELKILKIPIIKDLKVGYNLQDHVTTNAMLMELTRATSTLVSGTKILNEIKDYNNSDYKNGPLSATGPLHLTAFIHTEYSKEDETVPDIQFHFDGRNKKEFYSDPTTYLETNTLPLAFYDSINVRPILLSPKSRGYLTLNKTHPVFGQPLIYPRFFTKTEDIKTLIAAMRGRIMGGSSAVNYMVYMRGNKADYDGWAAAGNPGWSYREVLPYFKKTENNQDIESHNSHYHSVGGPLNVERFPHTDHMVIMLVEAFRETGLPVTDFNGEHQLGTDVAQSTSLYGKRFSVNAAYIRPIRHIRPNLKIVNQAYVTKVIINPVTKTAIGVEYIKHGAVFTVYASKEVIASSGPVNSPKLLMLSGVGPKEQLSHHNIPVLSNLRVGYNLQDHVTTDALIISLSNKTSTLVDSQQLLNEQYDYYRQPSHKHGPLASSNTLSAVAFIKTELAERGLPDIQFHFDGRNVEEFYADPPSYLASNIFPLAFYNGLAARPLLLVPKSKGYITLNYSDPLFGSPLIYPRFFTEKFDLDTLVSALRFAVSLEETPAFKQSGASYVKIPVPGCESFLWGSYEYFTCLLTHYTSTIYHPAGTCKMGPSWDNEAVVDARLRVYGIKRLRVIDSSIMPIIVRGNLNAPTVMIAEKAADMIKEDYYSY